MKQPLHAGRPTTVRFAPVAFLASWIRSLNLIFRVQLGVRPIAQRGFQTIPPNQQVKVFPAALCAGLIWRPLMSLLWFDPVFLISTVGLICSRSSSFVRSQFRFGLTRFPVC
jgi:hypothetical protein